MNPVRALLAAVVFGGLVVAAHLWLGGDLDREIRNYGFANLGDFRKRVGGLLLELERQDSADSLQTIEAYEEFDRFRALADETGVKGILTDGRARFFAQLQAIGDRSNARKATRNLIIGAQAADRRNAVITLALFIVAVAGAAIVARQSGEVARDND